jgi:hypothetical protein
MTSKRRSLKGGVSIFGLALVAVLALSALVASAASATEAPRWKVNGAYPVPGVAKPFTATSTSEVVLSGAGAKFRSPAGKCSTTGEIENGGVTEPGKEKNVVLTCKNVTIAETSGCIIHSPGAEAGTVTTNTLKGTLVWLKGSGSAAGELLEAASGTTLATIEVSGSGCAAANTYPVTNAVIDEFLPVEKESATSELVFPGTPILKYWTNDASRAERTITRLKVLGANATLSGKFSFSLNSKESVGVNPPGSPPAELRWRVFEGGIWKFLAGGEEKSFTATSTAPLSFSIAGVTMEIAKCTGTGLLTGSAEKTPGGEKNVVLSCTGAAVIGNPECNVHSKDQAEGVIVTKPLKGTLTSSGVKLEEENTEWFYLEITGTCGASILNGPITGQMTAPLDWGEGTTNAFALPPEGLLKRGANFVHLSGPFNYSLTGGQPFRVG